VNNLHVNVPHNITIVERIEWCGAPAAPNRTIAGCATVGDLQRIAISSTNVDTVTIFHEAFHALGVSGHDGPTTEYLMYNPPEGHTGPLPGNFLYNHLLEGEADDAD
jgi:hypothetical protein